MMLYTLNSEAETHAFGVECAPCIGPGQRVFLQGDLGAGKTSLAKGLLKGWGYSGIVTSPTFTLVESYSFTGFEVHHFDLYRIESDDELEMIGARELFNQRDICLIEWPARAAGFLPEPDILFSLQHHPAGRQVQVGGLLSQQLAECLQQREDDRADPV